MADFAFFMSPDPQRPLRTCPRCRPLPSETSLLWHRIRSSPACHHISSRLVRNTCVRLPVAVSVFADSAVRVLEWTRPAVAGAARGWRVVFMGLIFRSPAHPVHVQKSENRT